MSFATVSLITSGTSFVGFLVCAQIRAHTNGTTEGVAAGLTLACLFASIGGVIVALMSNYAGF